MTLFSLRLEFGYQVLSTPVTGAERGKYLIESSLSARRATSYTCSALLLLLLAVHKRGTPVGISPWAYSESSTCHGDRRTWCGIKRRTMLI